MAGYPKVLVATPTFEGKNYCLPAFIDNVANFTYPKNKMDFMIFDNSPTPDNAKMINSIYGVKVNWKDTSDMSVLERLAVTHEAIRVFAMNNHYDYILHLESDVFPDSDVIEKLIWQRKGIIGVPYMLFNGGQRRVVTQGFNHCEVKSDMFVTSENLSFNHHYFFDGTVKRCSTNGLGCTLIRTKIIADIPFRFVEGNDAAPDTWFSRDLLQRNIPYWVHTGMLAFHWNTEDWGEYSNLLTHDKKS
jgi:hypothetical protein